MAVVLQGSEPQINVRSGPLTTYDLVGVLLAGQKVPAKGRSPGGNWILIEYPGVQGGQAWVWSLYVRIEPLDAVLPIVEPPPTPSPAVTNTIDPTLAAKFIVTLEPTRLPTYTAPPPLNIPTFTADTGSVVGNIPMGFIIAGLAVLGLLLGVLSFAQSR
ncbi:MAG: SH3 domain-containing protein [Anaerolineae bacterium]|nr:SH3 domain-containing protein [Anaerolineae bacterium]